jgi:hypothetical protein
VLYRDANVTHVDTAVSQAVSYVAAMIDPSAATAAEPGRRGVAAAGETLGKYRLDRVLGAGGMGMVWAAFDPDLERAVALKLLHSADEPTLRTRLLREARAMARLKHPNVLTVYEVGTDQNRDYIAMEIVDGGTLDAWLTTKPPEAEVVEALLAAGRGLAAAHAAGLVHRDFKPHNVLRSSDGHIYVTDFGLARGQIEEGSEVEHAAVPAQEPGAPRRFDILASPLTQTGVMIGTPAYMAPEQFAGRIPDARTDQFAFCITAWEALTGARPFRGGSLPELEAAVGAGVRDLSTELPSRVRDVLARGLDPDPAERWPDVPALLEAFAAAMKPLRKSRRWIAIAVGVAVLGLGGATTIYFATRHSSSAPADNCEPGDKAYASAYPPERRTAILQAHEDGEAIGAIAILDEVHREWLRAYKVACSAPRTDAIRERIKCLLGVRDAVAKVTSKLAEPEEDFEMMQVVPLTLDIANCTGEEPRWGLPGIPGTPGSRPPPPTPPTPPPKF